MPGNVWQGLMQNFCQMAEMGRLLGRWADMGSAVGDVHNSVTIVACGMGGDAL
ncbi:hypothetical protein D3C75_1073290 [compost metagenome]